VGINLKGADRAVLVQLVQDVQSYDPRRTWKTTEQFLTCYQARPPLKLNSLGIVTNPGTPVITSKQEQRCLTWQFQVPDKGRNAVDVCLASSWWGRAAADLSKAQIALVDVAYNHGSVYLVVAQDLERTGGRTTSLLGLISSISRER